MRFGSTAEGSTSKACAKVREKLIVTWLGPEGDGSHTLQKRHAKEDFIPGKMTMSSAVSNVSNTFKLPDTRSKVQVS